MRKQLSLVIKSCYWCPFFDDSNYYDTYCHKVNKPFPFIEGANIPNWCPLPDAKEKKKEQQ